jgi:protein translocase SecG subunit
MMEILKGILLVAQAILSFVFIFLIMTQTSKNEGFGTIGVQAPTNFKGKPGYEERMKLYTRNLGISWILLAILTAWVSGKVG